MSDGKGSPGVSLLASVIADRVSDHVGDIDQPLDFGIIQNDFSLLTNSLPIAIPKGEYQVCRLLGGLGVKTTGNNITTTGTMEKLKKGDRVIVAWIQDEAVVIDVVVSSSNL